MTPIVQVAPSVDSILLPAGRSQMDESRTRFNRVALVQARLRHEYEFGDGWEHDIVVVEKVVRAASDAVSLRLARDRDQVPR
ncbi:MAG: IS1096 element passenger TnpR family protein [Candidatus Dormibacteria bacterium]